MSKSRAPSVVRRFLPALEPLEERVLLASTELVCKNLGGGPSNGYSESPSISANGRYVAFSSSASNLVTGDTNGVIDIFVLDRQTGKTRRVSLRSNGGQANGHSRLPAISADGRYVAFASAATNLVPGDTGATDIFVRDLQTGKTERVSVRSNGAQANGDSDGYGPSVSADGRYVAFYSSASNLVSGDTNGQADVFVRDRQTGTTKRVSVRSNGAQANGASTAPAISADGRYVAFDSLASNLVSGDTNAAWDVFVRDRQSGMTRRVSISSFGAQGDDRSTDPAISADGRYVAFQSDATNLVAGDANGTQDIFVRDLQARTTERVSVRSNGAEADFGSFAPRLSADGRYVTFYSGATNLVGGDTNDENDVFVYDRTTHRTKRVSVATAGGQGDSSSYDPCISGDGKFVAFYSHATNLVPWDTNGATDVFVRVL